MTTPSKTPRQQRIEAAFGRTTDRKVWRLLNRAWWMEFFKDRASEVADNRTICANEPYEVQGAVGAETIASSAPCTISPEKAL